jgi:hypothetical protein
MAEPSRTITRRSLQLSPCCSTTPEPQGWLTLSRQSRKRSMEIMVVLRRVALGSPRRWHGSAPRPPGLACTVWGGWHRVGKWGKQCRATRGIFCLRCRPRPCGALTLCGSTGASSMHDMGSWMSLCRRRPAGSAQSRARRSLPYSVLSPSTFCGASHPINEASKPDASEPDGIETILSRF